MKKLIKFMMSVLLVMQVVITPVFAASFTGYASTNTVEPGGTFTVSFGGECVGRLDITVDNGTISTNKVWVEENYQTITVTAGQSGVVTVTATPFEGFSTPEAELYDAGSRSVTVTIVQPKTSISNATISNISDQTYTGNAITPTFTVTLGGKTLVEGTDYTVSYANNINVGTATITITGIGNYEGTATKTFKIIKKVTTATTPEKTQTSITGAEVIYDSEVEYTGEAIEPDVKVVLNGKELVEGKDYTVTYSDNTEVGKGTITITGIGDYNGTITKTFDIVEKAKISIEDAVVSDIEDVEYTGSEIKPSVTVTLDGKELVEGKDYTVTYSNNIEVGTATITITGIGEYEGTITKTFSIIEGDKEGCTIHWIIAVVLVICAAIMYALAKTSALRFVIAGVGTVIAVAIAFIVGHCGLDLPIAIIGSIILIVEAITLNKTKKA